ncbi:MAG: hypothetical protein JW866_09060 [Ignavibacteriales bacterium]|nr:hypothetical protein [Ignavibacteriales bacterium]
MGKKHWVITRPKRKLILVPEILKIFYSVTMNEKWNRNRSIQMKFEKALKEAEWKAQNQSESGSGGRTYAALLFMLGLWYEDEIGVKLTLAGQDIIDGCSPVDVITKQLFNFQYPSVYSLKPSVNVDKEFQIHPYRFIVRLFLDKGYKELSQNEIGFCLVPFAKKNKDLNLCSDYIDDYRKNPERIEKIAVRESKTTKDNLINIGNTVVNQLLYTGFFNEGDDIKSLVITRKGMEKSKELLRELRQTLITDYRDVPFQKSYGKGITKSKDYSSSIRTKMDISPNDKKIIQQFYIIASREPVHYLSDNLIHEIRKSTGESIDTIKKVIEVLPIETQANEFNRLYLQISTGGLEFAKEFEMKTTRLFNNVLNIEANWVGNKNRHPDIILFLDKENNKHGIIDTKAYKEYNLPLDHKNKMAYTYIPGLKEITYKSKKYTLAFFGYVAGGFGNNIYKSFRELLTMANIPGHFITAKSFLDLLNQHKVIPFATKELLNLFSKNGEITSDEIIKY